MLIAASVVLLGACEVRTDVAVRVDEDGSGTVVVTVVMDAEAAARLGDPATALRTDDLAAAGWTLDEPGTDDGILTLRATRSFASPAELPGVLDEVGGVDGVFRGTELSVSDGFNTTTYTFGTEVELTGNPEQFGDELLTSSLGGLALGRTPEELAFEGAADPSTATLRVLVELPGGAPRTDGTAGGDRAVWEFPMTGGEPTNAQLSSESSLGGSATLVLFVLGGVALLVAVGLAVVGLVRRRA